MPKHKRGEMDARIEEVGHLRARGVPVAKIAHRFNVSERQIRYDEQEWLKRRRAGRGGDNLHCEQVLAEFDEVLAAAWSAHQRLDKGATSLDPKVARAKSELLRIVVSVIERKASLVGLSLGTQGASRTSDSPGLDGHHGDGRQSLNSMADVVSVLEQAVDDAASVNDPAARSRLRARLGQVAVKVLEKAELEERVVALEESLGKGRKS